MHILIATGIFPPDIGGPATYSKLLHDALPHHGISISVLSFGEVRHLPKFIRHIVYLWRVFLRSKNVDIIFAQDSVSVGFAALCIARLKGKKFIVKIVGDYAWEQYVQTSQKSIKSKVYKVKTTDTIEQFQKRKYDFWTELRRAIQKYVARSADSIITPSEYLKNIIRGWEVDAGKIKVVYNGVKRQGTISKEKARKNLDLTGKILVSAGRLVPWKGFLKLIDVIKELQLTMPDILFIIIGSGPEKKKIEAKIKKLKLESTILLVGKKSHTELTHILSAADIFILNTSYEGFSHQILEAMAVGVPTITTHVGGNKEIITHNINGILVDYDDVRAFVCSIEKIFSNEQYVKDMQHKAREVIVRFSTEKMLKETIAIFNTLIQS